MIQTTHSYAHIIAVASKYEHIYVKIDGTPFQFQVTHSALKEELNRISEGLGYKPLLRFNTSINNFCLTINQEHSEQAARQTLTKMCTELSAYENTQDWHMVLEAKKLLGI